jgi:hypothetical protein
MTLLSFATKSDIPRLVEMGMAYAAAQDEKCDPEKLAKHYSELIQSPDAIILTSILSEREYIITGFIAMLLMSNPVCDEKIAYKVHWLVDKKYPSRGIQLLRAAEYWAKMSGATTIFCSVGPDGAEKIMRRLKYQNTSLDFRKNI